MPKHQHEFSHISKLQKNWLSALPKMALLQLTQMSGFLFALIFIHHKVHWQIITTNCAIAPWQHRLIPYQIQISKSVQRLKIDKPTKFHLLTLSTVCVRCATHPHSPNCRQVRWILPYASTICVRGHAFFHETPSCHYIFVNFAITWSAKRQSQTNIFFSSDFPVFCLHVREKKMQKTQ